MPDLPPEELLARVLFSETKDIGDALAIAQVIMNRLKRPKRFGDTLEKVIYAPKQFSGVGGKEWKKVESGKLTPEEREIYENFKSIARETMTGLLPDETGGADHYYNPKKANPSWGKIYPETYKTEYHRYLKEQ